MHARTWHWGAALAATCATTPAYGVVPAAELAAQAARGEAKRVENLRLLAPDAVAEYERALALIASDSLAEAEAVLAELHHDVPGFTPATQHLCWTMGKRGKRAAALPLCREAAGEQTSESLARLSLALTGFEALDFVSSAPEREEAATLAAAAVERDPQNVLAQRALCHAMRAAANAKGMRACTKALDTIDTRASAATMWLERARLLATDATRTAEPDPVVLDECLFAAKHARDLRPEWPEPWFVIADATMRQNDRDRFLEALAALEELAREDPRTAELAVIAALGDGDAPRARDALSRAEALGLNEKRVAALRQQLDAIDPQSRWLPLLAGVLVISAGGLAYARRTRKERS